MTGDAALTARLPEIQARADAATPGPWTHLYSGQDCPGPCVDPVLHDIEGNPAHADLTFIAHAREDVPALLFEVARLTARAVAAEKRATEAEAESKLAAEGNTYWRHKSIRVESKLDRVREWRAKQGGYAGSGGLMFELDAIFAAPEKEGEQ